ncbi:MAG: glycosyltransferase [Armatimonadia bacterium]
MDVIAASFAIALAAALILTPLTAQFARRVRVVDEPQAVKLHKRSTPLLGGLAVLAAMFIGAWVMGHGVPLLPALTVSVTLVALVGLADDIKPVNPTKKMLALLPGTAAAVLLWPEPFVAPLISIPVFCLGFLFISNAVNLLDTVDGLTGLMTAISAAALGTMAWLSGMPDVAVAAFAMSGACLGFLSLNWRMIAPAGIFLGDMGALALGAGLFVLSAYLVQHAPSPVHAIAAVLPIGLVAVNAGHTIYIRKRKGAKALSRTKDHISERLYRSGLPRCEVTLRMSLVSLLTCIAATAAWATGSLAVTVFATAVGILPIALLALYSYRLKLAPEGTRWHQDNTICRIANSGELDLSQQLAAMGWHDVVICGSNGVSADTHSTQGIEVCTLGLAPRKLGPLGKLRAFFGLYRAIRRSRPQIVHTCGDDLGGVGRLAAALCETSFIVHSCTGSDDKGVLGRACTQVTSALIVPVPDTRDDLIRLKVVPPERIHVLPAEEQSAVAELDALYRALLSRT